MINRECRLADRQTDVAIDRVRDGQTERVRGYRALSMMQGVINDS